MSRESDFARNRLQLLTQALDRWISSASATLILPSLPVIIIRITKSDNDSIGNSIMALKLLAATKMQVPRFTSGSRSQDLYSGLEGILRIIRMTDYPENNLKTGSFL